MLRYIDTAVVFQEVPGEISLAVNISGCPCRCPGCHSPELWEDRGPVLDMEVMEAMIARHRGITCVCLMGGDAEPESILALAEAIKHRWPALKTCWYSGRELLEPRTKYAYIDYVKTGPYIKEKGPLSSPVTNQRFYVVSRKGTPDGAEIDMVDMTSIFRQRQSQ